MFLFSPRILRLLQSLHFQGVAAGTRVHQQLNIFEFRVGLRRCPNALSRHVPSFSVMMPNGPDKSVAESTRSSRSGPRTTGAKTSAPSVAATRTDRGSHRVCSSQRQGGLVREWERHLSFRIPTHRALSCHHPFLFILVRVWKRRASRSLFVITAILGPVRDSLMPANCVAAAAKDAGRAWARLCYVALERPLSINLHSSRASCQRATVFYIRMMPSYRTGSPAPPAMRRAREPPCPDRRNNLRIVSAVLKYGYIT